LPRERKHEIRKALSTLGLKMLIDIGIEPDVYNKCWVFTNMIFESAQVQSNYFVAWYTIAIDAHGGSIKLSIT